MALTEIQDADLQAVPLPRRCAIVVDVGNIDRIVKRGPLIWDAKYITKMNW